MSAFNVFTIAQLKKIIVYTGIQNLIRTSVTKPNLINQISKYVDFDGYNFTIKENNEQKFLKEGILRKPAPKPRLSKEDKKDLKILDLTKKEIHDIKILVEKNEEYIKKYMEKIKSIPPNLTEEQELYPKKKVRINKIYTNPFVEEPKKRVKINKIYAPVEEPKKRVKIKKNYDNIIKSDRFEF